MKELNKIYLHDCISFIQELENESVDLIIADPPYNLNKDFGNKSDNWENIQDWVSWCKLWIDECIRVLKPTGSIFVYGIHHYQCYIQCYLYEKQMKYRRQIIWYYENGFSGYKTLNAFYEPLLWFSKTDNFTYHEIREPYKSQDRLKNKIYKNGKEWIPNPKGRLAGDVWSIPTLAGKRFANEKVNHPTQKPLEICNRLVKHFSNENDIVLIPFAGSGSECVSCQEFNRNFLATEINPKYVDVGNKRLKNINLFVINNKNSIINVKIGNLNIDFYNMTEAAYHFEDEVDGNLEISQEPIEVRVFENQYFVEDGHHRILQKINNLEIQTIDFLTIEMDAILIFHNEKPNYLISENCKYGKIKDWYEYYYKTKL